MVSRTSAVHEVPSALTIALVAIYQKCSSNNDKKQQRWKQQVNYQQVQLIYNQHMQQQLKIQYERRWMDIYFAVRISKGYDMTGDTDFGQLEQFRYKETGQFTVIRNIFYGHKVPNPWIVKANQTKSIFFPFNPDNFNYNKMVPADVIFYLDIDKKQLVLPIAGQHKTQMAQYKHAFLMSGNPINKLQAMFIPELRSNHPQLLTPDLIRIVLRTKEVLPGMKVGFNSQGAASTVNHFHVQFISCQNIRNKDTFEFQSKESKFIGSRQTKAEGVELNISYFQQLGAIYLKIQSKLPMFHQSVLQQMVQTVSEIHKVTVDHQIPHNLMITDDHTFYFIVRNFANSQVRMGWLEYSGVMIARDEAEFNRSQEEIMAPITSNALPQELVQTMIADFYKVFAS